MKYLIEIERGIGRLATLVSENIPIKRNLCSNSSNSGWIVIDDKKKEISFYNSINKDRSGEFVVVRINTADLTAQIIVISHIMGNISMEIIGDTITSISRSNGSPINISGSFVQPFNINGNIISLNKIAEEFRSKIPDKYNLCVTNTGQVNAYARFYAIKNIDEILGCELGDFTKEVDPVWRSRNGNIKLQSMDEAVVLRDSSGETFLYRESDICTASDLSSRMLNNILDSIDSGKNLYMEMSSGVRGQYIDLPENIKFFSNPKYNLLKGKFVDLSDLYEGDNEEISLDDDEDDEDYEDDED